MVWILARRNIGRNTVLAGLSWRDLCCAQYPTVLFGGNATARNQGTGRSPSEKLAKIAGCQRTTPYSRKTPSMKRVAARVRMDSRTFLNHVSLHLQCCPHRHDEYDSNPS